MADAVFIRLVSSVQAILTFGTVDPYASDVVAAWAGSVGRDALGSRIAAMTDAPIWLTGDAEADQLLTDDDNALLIGMILDQQVPMEKAFSGPLVIAQRMGGTLDVAAIAAMPEEDFAALCAQRPAIHRFPAAMAKRVRQVCQVLTEQYQADAGNVWRNAATGAEMKRALMSLPGFGAEKAAIFTAVLGKRRGVQPPGWREAAGGFGDDGTFRSVADIVDGESLARVREAKRSVKAAKKSVDPTDR
jgi:uncharacterized HhH-GPD family protein